MQEIRGCNGKLVCKADGESRTVEILQNGIITQIYFKLDGSIVVKSSKVIRQTN